MIEINELFNNFHEAVKQRIQRYRKFYSFGEDSIRYDFYHTSQRLFNLNTTDLILEQALPSTQFKAKVRDMSRPKQGRNKDKPEYDLRIDPSNKLTFGLLAEFAFFRKTEISKNQDKTGRHGKLMNEIHRLALLKHYKNAEKNSIYEDFSKYRCLLVCVTDTEMIDYGYKQKGPNSIPIQNNYRLDKQFLKNLPDTILNSIDEKFLEQVNTFRIMPTADRIYEVIEPENFETPKWATWVWEINYEIIE